MTINYDASQYKSYPTLVKFYFARCSAGVYSCSILPFLYLTNVVLSSTRAPALSLVR